MRQLLPVGLVFITVTTLKRKKKKGGAGRGRAGAQKEQGLYLPNAGMGI